MLILLALWPAGSVVLGADPQPYSVTLKPTGNSALDSALHDAATLISLQDKPPVGGFALVQRARQDVDRFQSVLQSYGYYAANIDLTIAGHPITDPDVARHHRPAAGRTQGGGDGELHPRRRSSTWARSTSTDRCPPMHARSSA